MPIQTAGAFESAYTQDDIESTGVARATFEQAFSDLVGPSLWRFSEQQAARMGTSREYSPDEAKGWMAERGLGEHFTFDRPYRDAELQILASRKQKELRRADILQRADPSFGAAAGRMGLALATSFLDPLTVASAFVPVVGPARYAQMLKAAGSLAGRTRVRLAVGAAEGAAGAALVEPIIYGVHRYEQADYTLADSMLNIAFGTAFGGGLHAAGGALVDIPRARREAAAEARVREIQRLVAEQEALRAPTPFTPLVEVERMLTVPDVEVRMGDIYRARRADLERVINETTESDANLQMLFGTTRKAEAEAELRRLDNSWNRAKTAADRAKLLDGEDGPLWQALIDAERADNMAATEARIAELEAQRPELEARLREIEQRPVDGRMREEAEAAKASDLRDANRALRALDGELFQLRPAAEKLRSMIPDSARVTVLRADPQQREAALRTAVAQAVSGEAIEVTPVFRPETLPDVARRMSDPARAPLADPEAVRRADAVLAEGEAADLAAIQQQAADLDAQIAAMKAEAETMGADVAELDEISEQVAEVEKAASDSTKHAQMLAVCAMRHAA